MRTVLYLIPALVATAPYGAPAQQSPSTACEAAMAATGYAACAEAPHGIALAGTAERAAVLASFAQAGEERYAFTFGATPARYAVTEMDDTDLLKRNHAALKALGYRSILPWISHARMKATMTASFNQSAAAQARKQNLSPAAEAELARTMLAAETKRMTPFKMNETDAGAVPHELGHMWYAETYWPNRPPADGKYYGTQAPDWLDEMAAILMESQELADGRRRTFVSVYNGRGEGAYAGLPVNELIDLRLFFERIHPGFGANSAEQAEVRRTGQPKVIIKTGAEAAAAARVAGLFYSTGRLVADYMIDRAGSMAVFPAIAAAISRGDSFETWLGREGSRYRLPATMTALEADWRAWLVARFGNPGSAPKLSS